MKVHIIPFWDDNYSYIIEDEETHIAAFVDPANATLALQKAKQLNLNIESILTTHRHGDHAGGNLRIVKDIGHGINVYGGKKDDIPGCTHPVEEGAKFQIGKNLLVTVINAPCHTKGHVLYLVSDSSSDSSPAALFTGDSVFVAGCGAFFEGNGHDMLKIMNQVASLPPTTQIYCGHEYTEFNLRFSLLLEPFNEYVISKLNSLLAQGKKPVSVPSTVADEIQTNSFMRYSLLKTVTKKEDEAEVVQELRKMMNYFDDNYQDVTLRGKKPYWL